MYRPNVALGVLFLVIGLAGPPAVAGPPADLVIENARIWTNGRIGFAPFAAIRDGRFVHVGKPDPSFIGPRTQRYDARARVVLPGLIDAHVHMLSGGMHLSGLDLRPATSKADFIDRIARWVETLPDGAWVRGGRWSVESWADRTPPDRTWLDAVTGDRPAYLPRMDGHSALANSAALRLAGITRSSPPDPEGGVIDRDPATGEPTGILRESAMGLVGARLPEPSLDERVAALRSAMRAANRVGITAVGDIPGLGDLDAYAALAQEEMSVRFYLYPSVGDWREAPDRLAAFTERPGWVEVRGLKMYLDGSLGSRTAFMEEPFLGNEPHQPHWRGLLREGVDGGRVERNLAVAAAHGLQPIAHAIGDAANHLLLAMLIDAYGPDLAAARARSEHAQHLLASDIVQFGAHGVIASMQPTHKADDGRYAESYLGSERIRSSYAYRSLLDAGAVVAFGSDWPVVSLNPFLGVDAAVTGRTLDGVPWQTQENIGVAEALTGFTAGAAYALIAEHEIGRIADGYRADFIVLNASPFGTRVQWSELAPVDVYVQGRRVESEGR